MASAKIFFSFIHLFFFSQNKLFDSRNSPSYYRSYLLSLKYYSFHHTKLFNTCNSKSYWQCCLVQAWRSKARPVRQYFPFIRVHCHCGFPITYKLKTSWSLITFLAPQSVREKIIPFFLLNKERGHCTLLSPLPVFRILNLKTAVIIVLIPS